MSGKDDRNDLSGEGAVRPGLTATVALYAPAGSHSRRSPGQSAVIPHAICNYEYYQRRTPTIFFFFIGEPEVAWAALEPGGLPNS